MYKPSGCHLLLWNQNWPYFDNIVELGSTQIAALLFQLDLRTCGHAPVDTWQSQGIHTIKHTLLHYPFYFKWDQNLQHRAHATSRLETSKWDNKLIRSVLLRKQITLELGSFLHMLIHNGTFSAISVAMSLPAAVYKKEVRQHFTLLLSKLHLNMWCIALSINLNVNQTY